MALTIAAAAQVLGVAPEFLSREVRKGHLRAFGSKSLISEEAMTSWVERRAYALENARECYLWQQLELAFESEEEPLA